jgi:hypothetical protein
MITPVLVPAEALVTGAAKAADYRPVTTGRYPKSDHLTINP